MRISVHRGRGAFAADGTVLRRYAAAFHRAVPSAVGIHGAAVRRGPDHLERPDPVQSGGAGGGIRLFESRVRRASVGAAPAGGTAGLYPVQFSGIGTGMRGNFRGQPQRCPRQGSAGRSATITGKGTVHRDRPFSCGRACYIRLHIFGYSASGTVDDPPRRCQKHPPTPLGDGEGFQIPAADQRRPAEGGL